MTTDTDQELTNQLTNLKEGIMERVRELRRRGYQVEFGTFAEPEPSFDIHIRKTVETEVKL